MKKKLKQLDKKLKLLSQLFEEGYQKGYFNGSIGIMYQNKMIFNRELGMADFENSIPLTLETRFEIASITKQFTAVVLLKLQEKGKISIDDSLAKFYPKIPYPEITLRHLLTHTSGLHELEEIFLEKEQIVYNKDIIEVLMQGKYPLEFEPGTKMHYCNTNYAILADVIELVYQKPYKEVLADEIFIPCDMKDSGVGNSYNEQVYHDNFAFGYILENTKLTRTSHSKDADFVHYFSNLNGSCNCHSTILDLMKWDQALRSNHILSKDSIDQMFQRSILSDRRLSPYAFGWYLDEQKQLGKYATHSGNWPGYIAKYWHFLDMELAIVVLTNVECEVICLEQLFQNIMNVLIDHPVVYPKTVDEKIDLQYDKSRYQLFCGEYEPFISKECVKITTVDGRLFLEDFYHTTRNELFPIGEDVFVSRNFDWGFILNESQIMIRCGDPIILKRKNDVY